jgi:hypothetical protein
MAPHSSHPHPITPSRNHKRRDKSRNKYSTSSTTIVARGPGFVVWLTAPNGKTQGFITWAETAVAELSPAIQDAWHFPTVKAANDSVSRAFGAQVEEYGVAVFPAGQQ